MNQTRQCGEIRMSKEIIKDSPGQPEEPRQPQPSSEEQAPFRMPKAIPLFLGLGLLVVVVVLLLDVFNRVEADYEVLLLTEKSCTEEQIDAISRALVAYGEDRNGDGRIAVGVTPIHSENASDDEFRDGILNQKNSALLITDRFAYRKLRAMNTNPFVALDGTRLEAFPEREDQAVFLPLQDPDVEENGGTEQDLLDSFALSVGAAAEKSQENEAAINLADRIRTGQKTNTPEKTPSGL